MYQCKFYKGDYLDRQKQANADGCVAYLEHHFNSATSPSASYTVVITGANASQTSRNWGRWYAQAVAREFELPVGGDQGILVGGYGGRGDYNLRFTQMPAILLEPLFVSNPQQAEWVRSAEGQTRLARILNDSIQRFFQDGGLIGFSVGHKYKRSSPNDRGAAVVGGGWEADYAEQVLLRAKSLLEAVVAPQEEREIRIVAGDKVLFTQVIDVDADVSWDSVRGVLRIDRPVPVGVRRSAPAARAPRALRAPVKPAPRRKAKSRARAARGGPR
jgi:hypothetical protein